VIHSETTPVEPLILDALTEGVADGEGLGGQTTLPDQGPSRRVPQGAGKQMTVVSPTLPSVIGGRPSSSLWDRLRCQRPLYSRPARDGRMPRFPLLDQVSHERGTQR
jgi:hypothetical protein